MDLRLVRLFVRVCAIGSLSQAAERLATTQPALTRQMKRLEDQMGVSLLKRTSRGIAPTEAGQRLLAGAGDLLQRVRAFEIEVAGGDRDPGGEVSIGLPASFHDRLTLPFLAGMKRNLPSARPRILEAMDATLHDAMERDGIDLCITMHEPMRRLSGYEATILGSDDLLLMGPVGAFPPGSSIGASSLDGLPMILPAGPNLMRERLTRILAMSGGRLEVAMTVDTAALIADLVEAGSGFSATPGMGRRQHERLAYWPIAGAAIDWALFRRRPARLQLCETAADMLEDFCRARLFPTSPPAAASLASSLG